MNSNPLHKLHFRAFSTCPMIVDELKDRQLRFGVFIVDWEYCDDDRTGIRLENLTIIEVDQVGIFVLVNHP